MPQHNSTAFARRNTKPLPSFGRATIRFRRQLQLNLCTDSGLSLDGRKLANWRTWFCQRSGRAIAGSQM
jgi:hypothetical protein